MRASILLASGRRGELLRRTFPTVLRQREATPDCEIIIVLDSVNDREAEYFRSLSDPSWLIVATQEGRGQAAALNHAIRIAKGDVLVFLDDDLICEPGLVEAHLAAHAEGKGPFAVFGHTTASGDAAASIPARVRDRLAAEHRERMRMNGGATHFALGHGNSSIRRDVLSANAGFDEGFAEARSDAELGVRLWKAGVRFKFAHRAAVNEIYDKSLDAVLREAGAYGKYELRLCRLYPEYRPHSPLARWFRGSGWKAATRRSAARSAMFPSWLFRAVYRGSSRFERLGAPRRAAMKSLTILAGREYFRGALEEAGSWSSFRREFEELLFHVEGRHGGSTFRARVL